MTRLRIAVISAASIAGGLWIIAIAAIWINVNGQVIADARTAAALLGLAACIGLKHGKDRQERRQLQEAMRAAVDDKVTARIADAAVINQRAALTSTLPLPRVVR